MNKKMDETLVAQYKDLAIQRLEDAACRVFKYDKESDDFQQCGKPSAVIVDQDGPLETVFCAECYKTIERHPSYIPLEEITSLARKW